MTALPTGMSFYLPRHRGSKGNPSYDSALPSGMSFYLSRHRGSKGNPSYDSALPSGMSFYLPRHRGSKEILAMTEEFSCALPSGIDSYDRDFSPYQDLN